MPADTQATSHEETFVNAFVTKDYRDRLIFELRKRRGHFLGRFCHGALTYLDSRFVFAMSRPNSDPTEILRLLNSRGAERNCYAMSMSDDIDGRILPLAEALSVAVGLGLPTILSCVPGRLAYLETEQVAGPPDRFILFRSPSTRQ
jgi:hypothetical protein